MHSITKPQQPPEAEAEAEELLAQKMRRRTTFYSTDRSRGDHIASGINDRERIVVGKCHGVEGALLRLAALRLLQARKGGTRSSNSAWNRRRRNENFNNGQLYAMYRGWHHAVGTRMAVQLNKGLRSRGGRGRR
ncbi:hypothetical protein PPROV_000162600 [Pycnococcus provasolii]|uniref:Uncharacterized protein n=1 Tax=Pycnococcus provasolii TaxID=41880 RepID=A0A830HB95_9CHLO|nr:hypothetical protein PPROV_000162600 [Pycnococcus provasolii]